jgi:gas vesicle protein
MNHATRANGAEAPAVVSLATGLLIGGLVGFGVMMLFTPQSGKRTRDQIGQKSIELKDRATDTYDDFVVLSRFDNRKIISGTRREIENR